QILLPAFSRFGTPPRSQIVLRWHLDNFPGRASPPLARHLASLPTPRRFTRPPQTSYGDQNISSHIDTFVCHLGQVFTGRDLPYRSICGVGVQPFEWIWRRLQASSTYRACPGGSAESTSDRSGIPTILSTRC